MSAIQYMVSEQDTALKSNDWKYCSSAGPKHWKNYSETHNKKKPVRDGVDSFMSVFFCPTYVRVLVGDKKSRTRCNTARTGSWFFYAEIQIIFGKLYVHKNRIKTYYMITC